MDGGLSGTDGGDWVTGECGLRERSGGDERFRSAGSADRMERRSLGFCCSRHQFNKTCVCPKRGAFNSP